MCVCDCAIVDCESFAVFFLLFFNVSVETFEIIYFTFVLVFLIVSFIRSLKFAKL